MSVANTLPSTTTTSLMADTTSMIVEFLTKGYSDEDIFHIVPEISTGELEALKSKHCNKILRGMRDYYLVRKQSDDKMDYLESLALEKLEIGLALEMDSMKLLKIFQTLNSAKRRSEGEGKPNTTTTIHAEKVVQLNLPARMLKQQAQPTFETNRNNEVIRVGSTDMATATNTQVLAQLQARSAEALSAETITTEDI